MKLKLLLSIMIISGLLLGIQQNAHSMGRIPKSQYTQKINELESCNVENENLKNQTGVLTQQIKELQAEKDKIAAEKETTVTQLKTTYDDLMQDMKKEISKGEIAITQLQGKLSVSLVDKIVFNSGETELNAQGREVLKRVANILKNVKDKQIRIEGHTDNIRIGGKLKDKFPTNWELSTARATTIARYLQEQGSVTPELLSAAGYAQYHPIAENTTPEGRSKNRRIEIVLAPLDQPAATKK